MYYSIGWPKVFSAGGNEGFVSVEFDPSGLLVATFSRTSLYLWSGDQHRVLLAVFNRDPSSQSQDGDNRFCLWKPDSSRLAVVTDSGCILTYDVRYTLSSLKTSVPAPGHKAVLDLRVSNVSIAFAQKLASENCRITCMTLLGGNLLVGTTSGSLALLDWAGSTLAFLHLPDILPREYVPEQNNLDPSSSPFSVLCVAYNEVLRSVAVVLHSGSSAVFEVLTDGHEPEQATRAGQVTNTQGISLAPGRGRQWLWKSGDKVEEDFKKTGVDGVVTGHQATAVAFNGKYAEVIVGLSNGDAKVYKFFVDPMLESGDVSFVMKAPLRTLSLMHWGFTQQQTGGIRCIQWSSDEGAVAIGWAKKGLAVWSVSGCRLMCTLPQVAGAHSTRGMGTTGELSPSVRHFNLQLPGDTSKDEILIRGGVEGLSWGPGNYYLLMVPTTGEVDVDYMQHSEDGPHGYLVEFNFIKSAIVGNPVQNERTRLVLQGHDRILLIHSQRNLQLEELDLQHLHLPTNYLYDNNNWPLRLVAASDDASQLAAAANKGLCIYNSLSRRWRMFGDVNQEQNITAVGLCWFSSFIIIVANKVTVDPKAQEKNPEKPEGDQYELLFFPRYHLDQSSLLRRERLHGQPLLLDCNVSGSASHSHVRSKAANAAPPPDKPSTVQGQLLVYSADRKVSVFNLVLRNAHELTLAPGHSGDRSFDVPEKSLKKTGKGAQGMSLSVTLVSRMALTSASSAHPIVMRFVCPPSAADMTHQQPGVLGPSSSFSSSSTLPHSASASGTPLSLMWRVPSKSGLFLRSSSFNSISGLSEAATARSSSSAQNPGVDPTLTSPGPSNPGRSGPSLATKCLVMGSDGIVSILDLDAGRPESESEPRGGPAPGWTTRDVILPKSTEQLWYTAVGYPPPPKGSVRHIGHHSWWAYSDQGLYVWFPALYASNEYPASPMLGPLSPAMGFGRSSAPPASGGPPGEPVDDSLESAEAFSRHQYGSWFPPPDEDGFSAHVPERWLEFDREVYPLGVFPELSIIVGLAQGLSHSQPTNLPCFEPRTKQQLYLHCLLRHLLAEGHDRLALRVAKRFSNRPHFAHALEWLLHVVLEEEDGDPQPFSAPVRPPLVSGIPFIGIDPLAAIPQTPSTARPLPHIKPRSYTNISDSDSVISAPAYVSMGAAGAGSFAASASAAAIEADGDPRSLLPRVVHLIRQFPDFADIVVRCARKTDDRRWPRLFSLAGHPSALFEECFGTGRLRTAACYLVILNSTGDVWISNLQALKLLEAALDSSEYELARDVIRFLSVHEGKVGHAESPPLHNMRTSNAPPTPGRFLEAHGGALLARGEDIFSVYIMPALERLLARHARLLLSQMKLRQICRFVKNVVQFHLTPWLVKEGNRIPVGDWSSALSRLHEQFHLPLPRSLPVITTSAPTGSPQDELPATSPQTATREIEFLLASMLESGCHEWAVLLATLLFDTRAIVKLVSNHRKTLWPKFKWLLESHEAAGYRALLQVIERQITGATGAGVGAPNGPGP